MDILETRIEKGKIKKPILKLVTSNWTYGEDCPHILTVERLKSLDGKKACNVDALWDTGATICSMSKALAYGMDLKPIAKRTYDTANGEVEAEIVQVLFVMPDGTEEKIEVCVSDFCGKPYNFLVGMNVILKGHFEIEPCEKGFKFGFSV